jgi:hypothetical protein
VQASRSGPFAQVNEGFHGRSRVWAVRKLKLTSAFVRGRNKSRARPDVRVWIS